MENVRCLHRQVYSANWTTEELIHHMPVSIRTGRHCSLLVFYTNAVLLTLVGYRCEVAATLHHGICLHPFNFINCRLDDDDDAADDIDILRNVYVLLVEENVFRFCNLSVHYICE